MLHHYGGIRTPRDKRNRICGFFFFCAVFVLAAAGKLSKVCAVGDDGFMPYGR